MVISDGQPIKSFYVALRAQLYVVFFIRKTNLLETRLFEHCRNEWLEVWKQNQDTLLVFLHDLDYFSKMWRGCIIHVYIHLNLNQLPTLRTSFLSRAPCGSRAADSKVRGD